MTARFYLIRNTGTDLMIVADLGRHDDATVDPIIEEAIIDAYKTRNVDPEDDTIHLLTIGDLEPTISQFTGGYMDTLREKAGVV